ncbi:MAG: 4Fe-4S single cluster domain of Ferredoxin [Solirubrobacteraceae bacterium]|jgi:ferredoxin|nr:4Fe-4S single cluster domain of Ferredoxin [Solirubrobacteraceae bacterium]
MSENRAAADVDRHACIGSGNCLDIAPGAFEFDDDDKAYFVESSSPDRDTLIDAQQACPAGAITLRDGAS